MVKDEKKDGSHKLEKNANEKTEKDEFAGKSGRTTETETADRGGKAKKSERMKEDNKCAVDERIFESLTSEMAAELKERGLTFYENLGKGTFSTVMKGWCEKFRKMVAVKIIDTRKDAKYTRKCLPREIDIVRRLNHENIVKVHEVIEKVPYVCILLTYSERGDLLQKIKRKKKIDESEGKIHFRQLIEAMKYLKSMEVVHRDIKCENILLDLCENVKITDFGFARVLKRGEKSKTFCGSKVYLAPEIIRAQPYDGFLSDMWSAGIVLYVMTTGMMPYDDKNPRKMLEKQLQHRIVYPREVTLSLDVKRLIFDILHPLPQKRPTLEEVIRSKWLANTEYRILTHPQPIQ